MSKRTGDPITLGSGKLYYEEFDDKAITFERVRAICTAERRLALIKSGASIEYVEETYTEKDDLNIVSKTITTSEDVKLKGGLLTWTGNTINVLADRSKVTEYPAVSAVRTLIVDGEVDENNLVRFKPAGTYTSKELVGCWVEIDGQAAYIGDHTADTLSLYTDETKTRAKDITVDSGVTITGLNGGDILPGVPAYRETKIGGAGNAKGKYYVLVFHHEDKQDGDLWLAIVGRSTAGLSIAFANDSGSTIEPEFTAKPHDDDGTLVVLYEELGAD